VSAPSDVRTDLVLVEAALGVATITLNSPERRNALSQAMMAAIVRALDEVAADDSVRVVVLTHNGPVFSAGVDLKEAAALGMEAGTRALLGVLRAIVALPKPVVARIGGTVRAGGLGIVGACDVAVTVDTVTFAFTEARLGLAPAIISLTTLPWMAPRAAHRWCLTGETFDAAAAAAAGLVSQAVPPEALDATVAAVIADLLTASPQGLAETKRLLTRGMLARIDAEGEEILALSAGLFASEEAREGMTAFLERRAPRWAVSN
jgi:enoyl-CoA hydratase/carnithine racemase